MAGTLSLVRPRIRSRFWTPCHGGAAAALILASGACKQYAPRDSAGVDSTPGDTQETSEPKPTLLESVSGLVPDEGFGASLALDGTALVVGAPFAGGRVYTVDLYGRGEPVVALDGTALLSPTLGASVAGTLAHFVAG